MTSSALLLAAVLAAGPTIDVQRLDGASVSGELVAIEGDSVTLQSDGREQQIPLADLQSVGFANGDTPPAHAEPPPVTLTLLNGSRIACKQLTVERQAVRLQAAGVGELTIPLSQVRSVRLGDPDSVEARWAELQQRENNADLVVVRKGEVLDFVEASVGEINEQNISFLLGERSMNVPREKAFGIIYAQRAGETQRSAAEVHAGASVLQAQSVTFGDGEFQIQLPGDIRVAVKPDQVHRIDFSGRIRPLEDLEAAVSYPEGISTLDQMWHFRKGTASNGAPLRIGSDEVYTRRGLWMHSGVSARWRINRDYRRLTAIVGMDRNVDGNKGVRLVILGDGEPLFDEAIAAADPARPVDLDVSSVRDLEIRVERLPEFVSSDPFGTQEHLDLGNIRLVR